MDLKAQDLVSVLRDKVEGLSWDFDVRTVGKVVQVGDGVAKIYGLSNSVAGELLKFPKGYGLAINLEEGNIVGAIVLGSEDSVVAGDEVQGTGKTASIPVGDSFLGRVVNALGEPLDGLGKISSKQRGLIESPAPGVLDRQPVQQSLATGISAIDAMIPIGKGQRELIIGDRKTGKTTIAVDSILNQKGKEVSCIYVAIGQKLSSVVSVVELLKSRGCMDYTTVVVASASDSVAMQYLAPYSGCTLGEYFRDKGRDALVVYDDLSKHAVAYRQISLLLRRPPGREAYPGDVFYAHSRLLERAAKLNSEKGGGSLTALPIIETQASDISAYIPTNVISITDGQIYLEKDLFHSGIKPAVNAGLSVSRVGGSAQVKAMKKVAGRLRLSLAQFRELEIFSQFGTDLDENTEAVLTRGRRLREILKQVEASPLDVSKQIVLIYAGVHGYLDQLKVSDVQSFKEEMLTFLQDEERLAFLKPLEEGGDITEEYVEAITKWIESVLVSFSKG